MCESGGFDKDRHFAFLRDYGDSTLLFVANFSSTNAEMELIIPEHAFDWMGLARNTQVNPDTPLKINVNAFDASVIRLQSDE